LTAARRRSANAGRPAPKHAGGKRNARTAGHHTGEPRTRTRDESQTDRHSFRADRQHRPHRDDTRRDHSHTGEYRQERRANGRTAGYRRGDETNYVSEPRNTMPQNDRTTDTPRRGSAANNRAGATRYSDDRPDRRATGRNTEFRPPRRGTDESGVAGDARRDRRPTSRRDSDLHAAAAPGERRYAGRRDGDATGNRQDRRANGYSAPRRDANGSGPSSERRDNRRGGDNRADRSGFAGENRQERRRDGRSDRLDREVGPDPVAQSQPRSFASFDELGLPAPLSAALAKAGITTPFPIQAATLPDSLAGRDVLGRAQTGSGKTLAFGLALLARLNGGSARPKHPRALVLVPTRELAMQVADALVPLAKSLGLWCATIVGGMSFSRQNDVLRRGADLVIATPGRLSDHVRQGTCDLSEIAFTAVDEADQMADMGFLPQVRAILDLTPNGQRMLFSATLDGDVATLIREYLTNPVTHSVAPSTASVTTMDHHLLFVSKEDKPAVIAEVANRSGRTIMFLRTKHHVDRLTTKLRSVGVNAGALHGGKTQSARNRVLDGFKTGGIPVLVATDVAARGIHVDDVSLVVHVDPPADAKAYLHRAGRTARAGESGTVVTLVTHQDRRSVHHLTKQAGVTPTATNVRPGANALVEITGAREPSGEPVIEKSAPAARRPPRRREFTPNRGRPTRTRRPN